MHTTVSNKHRAVPPRGISPMLPVLSAGEVRSHLRTSSTSELALIRSYLLAAQDDIEIQCERALVTRRYRITMPCFPQGRLPVELQMCPVRKIIAVSYFDGANDTATYDDYVLMADQEPGLLYPELDNWWPATYSRPDCITISFWAGRVAPITFAEEEGSGSGDPTWTFTSTSGYPFADGEEVVISCSGNTNSLLGETAVLPTGLTASTTYYVVDASEDGLTFRVAETAGGDAIPLQAPTAGCQAIDLLYAGALEPWERLAMLQTSAKAFGQRCPEGGCVCTAEDYESDPTLRRLKWRSPVEFY